MNVTDGTVFVSRNYQELDPGVFEPDFDGVVLTGDSYKLPITCDCHSFDRLGLVVRKPQAFIVNCNSLLVFLNCLHLMLLSTFLLGLACSALLFWRARFISG